MLRGVYSIVVFKLFFSSARAMEWKMELSVEFLTAMERMVT